MQQFVVYGVLVVYFSLRMFGFLYLLGPLRNVVGLSLLPVLAFGLSLPVLKNLFSTLTPVEVQQVYEGGTPCFVFYAIFEISIGLCLALPVNLAMEMYGLVGRFIDVLRGVQYAEQVLPGSGERGSAIEQLGNIFVLVVLFQTGIIYGPLKLLWKSFSYLPPLLFGATENLWMGFFERTHQNTFFVISKLFAFSIISCFPIIVFIVVFELSSGLISRFAGKLNCNNELLSLRVCLPLAFAVFAFSPKAVNALVHLSCVRNGFGP